MLLNSKAGGFAVPLPFAPRRDPTAKRTTLPLRTLRLQCAANAATVPRNPAPIEQTWWKSPHDKLILNLAIPALCANILTPLSSSIDAAVVGRLGAAQLSGVGIGGLTLTLLSSFFGFMPLIVTPIIARKNARKENVSKDVSRCVWLSLMLGAVAGSVVFFSVETVIQCLGPSAEIKPFALAYLKTLAFMVPVSIMFQTLAGIFRGIQDSAAVLRATICSAATNLFFDLLFVNKLGWSVSGVALATVISICVGSGYLLSLLAAQGKLRAKDFFQVPDLHEYLPMVGDGMRLGLRNVAMLSLILGSSALIAKQGAVTHSAYEICRQTAILVYVLSAAIEQTVQALSAHFLGLNNLEAARSVIVRCIQLVFVISSACVMVLFAVAGPFAGIFTSNSAVIAAYVSVAPIHLFTMPLSSVITVVDGALIGASRRTIVANWQSLGALLGMLSLVVTNRAGLLNLCTAWIVLRCALSAHGLVTASSLFISDKSPYDFRMMDAWRTIQSPKPAALQED